MKIKQKQKSKTIQPPRKPPNNFYGWLKYRHVLQMITYQDTLKDNICSCKSVVLKTMYGRPKYRHKL